MTVGKDVSGLFPDVLKNMVSLEKKSRCVMYGGDGAERDGSSGAARM
jgi:hypothetical protein